MYSKYRSLFQSFQVITVFLFNCNFLGFFQSGGIVDQEIKGAAKEGLEFLKASKNIILRKINVMLKRETKLQVSFYLKKDLMSASHLRSF